MGCGAVCIGQKLQTRHGTNRQALVLPDPRGAAAGLEQHHECGHVPPSPHPCTLASDLSDARQRCLALLSPAPWCPVGYQLDSRQDTLTKTPVQNTGTRPGRQRPNWFSSTLVSLDHKHAGQHACHARCMCGAWPPQHPCSLAQQNPGLPKGLHKAALVQENPAGVSTPPKKKSVQHAQHARAPASAQPADPMKSCTPCQYRRAHPARGLQSHNKRQQSNKQPPTALPEGRKQRRRFHSC